MIFQVLCEGQTFDMSKITGADSGVFSNWTTAVENTGNSLIFLGMMVVGFIGVLACLIVGGKLLMGGSNTKASAKGDIGWGILGLIIAFGAIMIVGAIKTFSENMFSNGGGEEEDGETRVTYYDDTEAYALADEPTVYLDAEGKIESINI